MSNVILTSLGKSDLKETVYTLNDKSYETKFCCLALGNILNEISEEPDSKVIALLTKESEEKHGPTLKEEAEKINLNCEIIRIAEGKTIDEVWQIFDSIIDTLSKSSENDKALRVYLDITNGFRHLPLLFFAALNYLEANDEAELGGIFYGAYEAKWENYTPIFDLSPLTTLVGGAFAVQSFMETGGVKGLGEFFAKLPQIKENKKFNESIEKYHLVQAAGLVLEAGKEAQKVLSKLPDVTSSDENAFKAGNKLIDRFREYLKQIALAHVSKRDWKKKIELNIEELKRQLNFIENKISQKNVSQALILLREWIISRVWLAQKLPADKWLNHKSREELVEKPLGILSKNGDNGYKSELAKLYDVGDTRNEFAHAGFRQDTVHVEKKLQLVKDKFKECKTRLADDEFWKLPEAPKTEGKLLISGLGISKGLLYSAFCTLEPDLAVVITSDTMKESIPEICSIAGNIKPEQVETVVLQEPFTGFNESQEIVNKIQSKLKSASEIIVNLTGGTTCMQWIMQSIYGYATEKRMNVKCVAFVDRRPTIEQQQNPFVVGELIEIRQESSKKTKQ